MVNFGELAAEIISLVWASQLISTVFASWLSYCSDSLNGRQLNFAGCLAVSWAGALHIHFRGFLPRYGILPGAKFTLHPPSLALSYFGSVTAQHLSSGREPNFAALSTGRHLYSAGRPSRWALAHILVLSSIFFSSPNLSRPRLDVYHTSTYDVALVRI